MLYYIVNGVKVSASGVPLSDEQLATLVDTVVVASDVIVPGETDPFADLTPAVQKSLVDAGITTVEQAKALGRDGLIALDNIGTKTSDEILAL